MSDEQIKHIRMGFSPSEHEEVRVAAEISRQSMLKFSELAALEKARAINEKRK